ncbi:MAG TPA: ABC transporter substrate-binding protein [Planctomycetota bacterium]|nr:ABC transporter substrate-binding protein [Planctomycetota bacterium]
MRVPHFVLLGLGVVFGAGLYLDKPVDLSETPEKITVTYWEKWTGFESEAMRGAVELFNSKKLKNHKGQVIECHYTSITHIENKATLAIAGGEPPDVIGLFSRNTVDFADLGALLPLDDYIRGDDFIKRENYIEVFWDNCQYRGHTWSLPTTPATVALHWNKDLFKAAGLDPDRPPTTLKELEEFAEKLSKKDENGRYIQIGFSPPEPGWWPWAWPIWWDGKYWDPATGRITADHPNNVASFEWLNKFRGYGAEEMLANSKSADSAFDSPQNLFLSGKVAMVLQGVWMANFIRFHNPHLNYGCAPFPAAFDTHGQPVGLADMDTVAIPRGCRHPEEAWAMIKFLNSLEGAEYYCGAKANNGGQGKFTAFKMCSENFLKDHSHPYLQVFIDIAKSPYAKIQPQLPMWYEYEQDMRTAFERSWLGEVSPKKALEDVQGRMQRKYDRIMEVRKVREQK